MSSSDSRFDAPAGGGVDGASVLAGCGVDVTDNGNGTVTLSADLEDIIGAANPNEAANGLIVLPTVVEPGQCRHIEVALGPSGGIEEVNERVVLKSQVLRRVYDYPIDNTGATGTMTERPIHFCRVDETVIAVMLTLRGGVTGNDTNFLTITIRRRDGAGGAAATIVAYSTTATPANSIVANIPKNLGALANTALVTPNIVTAEITKTAAGVSTDFGLISVICDVTG